MTDKNTKHLLFIRFSAMGDVAIAAPLLQGLVQNYPHLKITVLTKPFFAPIFENISPNIKVFKADVKKEYGGIWGLFKLYKALNALQIDGIADIHNVLRTNILKFFFLLSGTPFVQIDKGREEKKALTALTSKELHFIRSSFLRYSDVAEQLGFKINAQKPYFLPPPTLLNPAKSFLPVGKKYIGIAPFAAHIGKEYPFEKIKIIVKELSQKNNYHLLLFGSKGDAQKLATLASHNVVVVAGSLPFEQELALIARLSLMLSMDSGNGHLSAMYGVPTVTIWGVTHPCMGFTPYFQKTENQLVADRIRFPFVPTSVFGNTFPQGYENAITTVSVVQVLRAIRTQLGE